MAEAQDELLVSACERIWACEDPAYLKNGEMRYLAVNAAFARLFNRQPADFIGLRGDEVGETMGHEDREERERRCLVFGTAERARYFHPFGGGSFTISLQRQQLSGDLSVVIGTFTPSTNLLASNIRPSLRAAAEPDGLSPDDLQRVRDALEALDRPVAIFAEDGRELVVNAAYRERGETQGPETDTLVESALDVMGAGVAVFGADNRLTYVNRSMREFYRVLVGDAVDGPIDLETLMAALYQMEVAQHGGAQVDKAAWIAARMKNYELPLYETVSRTAGGWMRLVTQRRPDGVLVALRMDVTALKENEGRVQQHTQEISLYRALLDELPVASFMRDENQRMIFANRAYQTLTGKNADELIGMTTLEMFPLQGVEFHEENQRVLETGALIESEVVYQRSDGVAVPTISRLYRVTTIDEKNYLIGSITDTSVLKKRENQLIVAQQQAEAANSDLESIVESVQVGIVVVDEDSVIELVNGAFEALWDGKLPAMEGQPFGALLRFQREHGRKEAGDEVELCPESYEQWLCAIRAEEFPAREVAYANGRTLIEAGQPISGGRCLLTYIDITERREREREVLETRSALEDIGRLVKDALSAMSQGLLIIDSGRVVLVNEALHGMVTLPPQLLEPGAALSDIFQHCIDRKIYGFHGDRRVEAEEFETLLRPDEHVSLTIFSGLNRWMQLDSTPTGHGRMVLVFSDITELKEREEQLQQLVLRAETADKAKSEFLANMSHEIRTPMNGVLGMAELLAKSSLDTRQKTFIDIMVKSGNALLTIINDILDFSKIDAGQMTLRKVPFNLVEAIEDVATLLSAKAAEKDIELVVRGAADMPASVVGDAGRFRQIVTNLIGNAVKFTDRGHVLIAMGAEERDDDTVTITLQVEDTGAGIPSDKLSAVFEKFSQVDSSTTRRHEGTGLGLAITDGLVRLFGGTLEVASEVGKGSTFTVVLPMAIDRASASRRSIPSLLRGARVLVVDDHEVTRETACAQLAEWGFDATAVFGGADAIALIEAARDMGVDVETVVIDLHMQDVAGAPLADTIRKAAPGIGMVLLSSLHEPQDVGRLEALDIDAHLMKPVRAELLRETVSDVVRSARAKGMPPRRQEGASSVVALSARAERETIPSSGAGVDVLVAEDNEVNQILFTQLLEGAGVSFHIASNGAEAVEAFERLRPRMILMDVSMPVMSGHQATAAIRELEKTLTARVPIVAVTAHVLDGDREACLASGMDDYMTKPISTEKLEDMVRRWLGSESAAEARRATLH